MSISSSAPWLKYYGDTPQHLKYPQKTIYEMVKSAADKYPKNYAYEFMGKKTTYAEFMQKIDAAAKGLHGARHPEGRPRHDLHHAELPAGRRQLLRAQPHRRGVRRGSTPCPRRAEIERSMLNFSKSKAILTLDQFYGKIAPIMPELDNPDTKLVIAKIEDELFPHLALGYALTAGRKYPHPERKGNYIWWKEFLRKGKKLNAYLPKNAQKPEDGASILYSGGTTGTTKGILLSNMNFNALGLADHCGLRLCPHQRAQDALRHARVPRLRPWHRHPHGVNWRRVLHPRSEVRRRRRMQTSSSRSSPTSSPAFRRSLRRCCARISWKVWTVSCLKGVFCGRRQFVH